jgi:hypothetical protein
MLSLDFFIDNPSGRTVTLVSRHAVAQLAKELRYKPEGRGFDYPMLSLEFFIDIILPVVL